MGQGEIFQFLKENEGQIFTGKEICIALDIHSSSNALTRLRKHQPEGFNFSKESFQINIKKRGKLRSSGARPYIYWYKNSKR